MAHLDGHADDSPAATSRFEAWLANARNGRNGVGRISLSILIVAASWILGTVAVFACGLYYGSAASGEGTSRFEVMLDSATMDRLLDGQLGMLVMLTSIAAIWIGVWMAVTVVHRRRLSSLFGVGERLERSDFRRAALAAIAVGLLFTVASLAIDPTITRTEISIRSWLFALPVMVLLVLFQSSAEELFFRGYLHQVLAVRFGTPLVWAAIPTAAFTLLHWNGGISSPMNAAMLFSIASFAVVLTVLLVRTGNLAGAMGAHFGNNIVAVLFVSSDSEFGMAALLEGKALGDPSWTATDAFMLAIGGALSCILLLAALLHRRSPLRLRSA